MLNSELQYWAAADFDLIKHRKRLLCGHFAAVSPLSHTKARKVMFEFRIIHPCRRVNAYALIRGGGVEAGQSSIGCEGKKRFPGSSPDCLQRCFETELQRHSSACLIGAIYPGSKIVACNVQYRSGDGALSSKSLSSFMRLVIVDPHPM